MVLLKGADQRGFRFFTNHGSRKGLELAANPLAALCFWWPALGRQVRVEGRVSLLDDPECDAYFASRSRESQLAAACSPQSRPIPDLAWLEAQMAALEAQLAGRPVPRPAQWGGYLLAPEAIELWQRGPHRRHERRRYRRDGSGWALERLAP
jgi:pyridoxamine 5'-phosphate oxidase